MSKQGYVWVYDPKPVKLDDWDKKRVTRIVQEEIEKTTIMKQHVSRINVSRGRVYLYYLYEPQIIEGIIFTKPLIDGKYLEITLARFTIYDKNLQKCTFDWQRHNDQWMTLGEGTLVECIHQAEESGWLSV